MTAKRFQEMVYSYYRAHGRHDLPWRKTTDPYKIAVSELMLQQTQVSRVLEKYRVFVKQFPTVRALARAPLREVLVAWSGLGYNRRAKFLHQMASAVVHEHKGVFPKTSELLQTLPGIGPYTARAIAAFAYNTPSALIETNIRTVYIRHFFADRSDITDRELLPIIERTLDRDNPRMWYWALMDYGAYLKSEGIRTHRASAHYLKQSTFNGSTRQVRGMIVKLLITSPHTAAQLYKAITRERVVIDTVLSDLLKEGLIRKAKGKYTT